MSVTRTGCVCAFERRHALFFFDTLPAMHACNLSTNAEPLGCDAEPDDVKVDGGGAGGKLYLL
jgi:hypothetical protein